MVIECKSYNIRPMNPVENINYWVKPAHSKRSFVAKWEPHHDGYRWRRSNGIVFAAEAVGDNYSRVI